MPESKLNKLSNILNPVIMAGGAVFALYQQFSLQLLWTFLLYLGIFVLLTFYNWRSKTKNSDFYKNWVLLSIKVFISVSLLLTILLVVLSFLQTSFPAWHSSFTNSHFLKADEIKELKPEKVNKDSALFLQEKLKISAPYLLVLDDPNFLFFENEKITGELIRYGSNDFRKFCNYIFFLLLVLSLVLIYLDQIPARDPES